MFYGGIDLHSNNNIYPAKARAVRDLLRKRGQLVQQRTRNILSIENLTSRNCGVLLRHDGIATADPSNLGGYQDMDRREIVRPGAAQRELWRA